MRILELTIDSFKRLGAVDIVPDQHIVQLQGKNKAGKSSVIDAIWSAIGGKGACPERPIRDGEDHARVTARLGDGGETALVATRTWTPKGDYLTVTMPDGQSCKSPQAVLDELYGTLTFDPLAFKTMKPADRNKTLSDLLGITEKRDALRAAELEAFRARREAKNKADTADREAEGIAIVANTPAETVSVVALSTELEDAGKVVQANEKERQALSSAHVDLEAIRRDLLSATQTVTEAEEKLAAARLACAKSEETVNTWTTAIAQQEKAVAALADPDLEPIRKRIASAERVNGDVANKKQRAKLKADAARHRREHADQDTILRRCKADGDRLLKDAAFPVDGLGFIEDGVTFNGLPFDQIADSEKLRISVAMGMAMNPKLRVMFVHEGSLLDDDSLQALYGLIRDGDFQLWIERVGGDGSSGILIEDGTVKSAAPPAGPKENSDAT